MRGLAVLAAAVVGTIVIGSGVAYATGNIPESITPKFAVNDAWIAQHCTGEPVGRSARCPGPGRTEPSELPTGRQGSLVAFGDSFSAGEGAPETGIYAIGTEKKLLRLPGVVENCASIRDPFIPCYLKPKKVPEQVWLGASGYQRGSDVPGDQGNACHRSRTAYPALLAEKLDLTLDFKACSGGVTQDYVKENKSNYSDPDRGTHEPPQRLNAAEYPDDTRLVTVGFGGNNVHFSDLVKACLASQSSIHRSLDTIASSVGVPALLRDALYEKAPVKWLGLESCAPVAEYLTQHASELVGAAEHGQKDSLYGVFADIRDNAPGDARVIAVSYPRLFPEKPKKKESCSIGSGEASIGYQEQRAVNDLVIKLNGYIREAATDAGIDFVDMTDVFTPPGVKAGSAEDHGLCQDQGPDGDPSNPERWVNRFRLTNENTDAKPENGSVHPNARGQQAYFDRVLKCYDKPKLCSNYVDRLAKQYNFPKLAAKAGPCPEREAGEGGGWVEDGTFQLSAQDLTGDEDPEIAVRFQCVTQTSSNPDYVAVFANPNGGDDPLVLGVLGMDTAAGPRAPRASLYFGGAQLSFDPPEVTMAGKTVGPDDGLCCADHWGRMVWRWQGNYFKVVVTEEADTSQPILHAGWPDGTRYAVLAGANKGEVFLDEAKYYDEKASLRRCLRKYPAEGVEVLCPEIHGSFDRGNDLVRALRVEEDAHITWLDVYGSKVTVDGDAVAGIRQREGNLFKVHVKGGDVTRMEEVFLP